MLLDDFLPHYQFNEVHSIRVHAPIDEVYRAFKDLTAGELSPLVGLMFAVRGLPGRLLGKSEAAVHDTRPFMEQMLEGGFLTLAEKPPEEIVFGLAGQFWKLSGDAEVKLAGPEEFIRFDDPDCAKTAANFLLTREADGWVRISTETRVEALGPAARRKFSLYWGVISMGSGLIRMLWLRAIKRRAERGVVRVAKT